MLERRALGILLQACSETLADARTGETWLSEVVVELESLRGRLETELAALRG